MKRFLIVAACAIAINLAAPKGFAQDAGVEAEIAALHQQAESGDAEAADLLSFVYSVEDYGRLDPAESLRWKHIAAENGLLQAQKELASWYLEGSNGVARDEAQGVRWLKRAAEQNDPAVQFTLGVLHEEGRGVEQNYAEAMRWYQLAQEQNYGRAGYNLAIMHLYGRGTAKDPAKAALMLQQIVDEKLSGLGDAAFALGQLHRAGEGVEQSDEEFIRLMKIAAANYSLDAKFMLATVYEEGIGVEANPVEAFGWYLEMAQTPFAKFKIAEAFFTGNGVEQNLEAAYAWSHLAAIFARSDKDEEEANAKADGYAASLTDEQKDRAIEKLQECLDERKYRCEVLGGRWLL